jgi:hypothetical protein
MNFSEQIFDIGNVVICDGCGEDYTKSDAKGGVIFSGNAYCPDCKDRIIEGAKRYNEEKYIEAICDDDVKFNDFVLAYRNGDNTIKIISW